MCPVILLFSLGSAAAIADTENIATAPVLHTDLTSSAQVYQRFVEPLLRKTAAGFLESPETGIRKPGSGRSQFTRLVTGRVSSGNSKEVVVNIEENAAVASFALYDPTRSLTVTVRGASGKVINLSAEKHGLRIIQDPSTLLYMGYGFDRPKPGQWRVTVQATEKTPSEGARFAIMAKLQGGARLNASTTVLLP